MAFSYKNKSIIIKQIGKIQLNVLVLIEHIGSLLICSQPTCVKRLALICRHRRGNSYTNKFSKPRRIIIVSFIGRAIFH